MFHRATFGERLENEKTDNIKISGSRGSREMTFVIGKVCPLIFNYRSNQNIFILLLSSIFFFVEKTAHRDETP